MDKVNGYWLHGIAFVIRRRELFDCVVEHLPNRKGVVADALARIVSMLTKLSATCNALCKEEQATYGKEKIDYEHGKIGFNKGRDQIARSFVFHDLSS